MNQQKTLEEIYLATFYPIFKQKINNNIIINYLFIKKYITLLIQ